MFSLQSKTARITFLNSSVKWYISNRSPAYFLIFQRFLSQNRTFALPGAHFTLSEKLRKHKSPCQRLRFVMNFLENPKICDFKFLKFACPEGFAGLRNCCFSKLKNGKVLSKETKTSVFSRFFMNLKPGLRSDLWCSFLWEGSNFLPYKLLFGILKSPGPLLSINHHLIP